jgi:uncharacterized membrane protein
MRPIDLLIVFVLGSLVGKAIEITWRSFKAGSIVHSGFCKGPYSPIYGFGALLGMTISSFPVSIWLRLLIFVVVVTSLELITGLALEKAYHVKLWDYSDIKLNYKGLICPFYTMMWSILGIVFLFGIYPHLGKIIKAVESSEIALIVMMLIAAVILIDMITSSVKFALEHRRKY